MQTIKLSTTPGVVNPGAYLSQYDVGRQLLFLLYDDVGKYIPAAGSTVHIRATKPSGFGFDVACIWSQNSVTVTVTDEMSNESGSFSAELRIEKDDAILGTANFLWNVERSTHPDGTVDGNTEAKGLMQAIMAAIADAENAAAAAISASHTAGFSEDFKEALLDCFAHVAWIDGDGQDYYDALEEALNPPIPATSITLNKSSITSHSINVQEDLAVDLQPPNTTDTITWSSSDTSVATVSEWGTVRIVGWGTAIITATAGNVSATCTVTATNVTLSSIDAVFTQGGATIYTDDTLDSLKQYLVVTATYSDSSTEVLDDSDYTLSGTLTAGTSTITATYITKTDTFNVTVTQAVQHYAIVNNLTHVASSNPVVTVEENDSFATALGVQTGYAMQSVTVTMGGVDITSSVYNSETRAISIPAVTGNVVITAVAAEVPSSISAVYTPGDHVVYEEDSLDSLKAYLVVTASYSGGSTATVAPSDYTLSGTLAVGTSTVTVTYVGVTTTFTVTVSDAPHWVNNVMIITKDNGIVQGKIGNAYPYHNESGSANRCTYCGLEADVSTEYKYTFNYETTLSVSTNIGVQCVNYAGVQAAMNHNTMQDSQRNDYLWQSDGFVLYPKTWDKTAWFTFRRENGTTAVYPENFPEATITRQKIDWVNNVMTLTNDWFIRGGLTNFAPKYYNASKTGRVSYNGMAVDVETGYKYTIHYSTDLNTSTNIGIQYLDDSDLTKYATAQNVETTDLNWQDDGYVFKMSENPTAKKLWFTFRAGDGSTSITPSNFTQITITREAE